MKIGINFTNLNKLQKFDLKFLSMCTEKKNKCELGKLIKNNLEIRNELENMNWKTGMIFELLCRPFIAFLHFLKILFA